MYNKRDYRNVIGIGNARDSSTNPGISVKTDKAPREKVNQKRSKCTYLLAPVVWDV